MPDGFPQLLHHVVCPPEVWECSSLCVHQKRRSVPVSLVAVVQLLSHVRVFVTLWAAARQASLSITNSPSLLKLLSIEWMPSNHLILCCPLLLLPSIFPNIVFSKESALHIRWPKYWSFSFNISPFNEHPGLIKYNTK